MSDTISGSAEILTHSNLFEKWLEIKNLDRKTQLNELSLLVLCKKSIPESTLQKFILKFIVDQPKHGYGSTNTGNTARVFFRNAEKAADITGVDEELIKRFHIILQALSSGFEIDTEKFNFFALETAERFVALYPWYYMPTSVHKVLIHGAEIIKHAILPIGQLGEEAQEAKNKDFKFVREHRTRKDAPEHTNEDLLIFFILSSDPMISTISMRKGHNKLKLSPEVVNLLKCSNSSLISGENTDNESNISEDSA